MPADYSVANPGPMGWGGSNETIPQRYKSEAYQFEILASTVPEMLEDRPYREPNPEILARLKTSMDEDGIEGGFSCFHMEPVVFGYWFKWLRQIIGSCVGSGYIRAAARRALIEVHLLNQPEEIPGSDLITEDNLAFYGPFGYRAGRSIAGINRGDGSYCSAQIQGAQRYGNLPCWAPGLKTDAYPEPQSASLYRQYGNSDQILTDHAELAAQYKLLTTSKITNADQGKEILTTRFEPFMICSNWAFRPKEMHPTWRDRNGARIWIYERDTRTSWAHNMTIIAFVLVDGMWYVIVENSWGMNAHKNGSYFVIPIEVYATWCRSAEQMSVGDINLKDNQTPV